MFMWLAIQLSPLVIIQGHRAILISCRVLYSNKPLPAGATSPPPWPSPLPPPLRPCPPPCHVCSSLPTRCTTMLRWTRAMRMWTGRISCSGSTGRCPTRASWRRSGGGRGTRTRGTSANAWRSRWQGGSTTGAFFIDMFCRFVHIVCIV